VADNVTLNSGSGGETLATDQLAGGEHVQFVKLMDGTANGDGKIAGDAANGLDVDVTRVQGTVTVDGSGVTQPVSAASLPLPSGAATSAKQDDQTTALQIMDDWDESDRAKVNPIVGQAGIAAGAGAVGATVPRVTLASDDPGVALLTTIDGDTGGILTAAQIIDDWDESDRAKVNPIVGQAGVAAGAGAVGATVQRTTLASDDPAVVALQIIDDWDESDRAKVNIVAGQAGITAGAGAVGASTPRVTLASDDPAVASLASILAQLNTGMSFFKSIDLDESEEEIKDTAGRVLFVAVFNRTAAPLYLKFYDVDADDVTVGTTEPGMTFVIPGNADSDGAGFILPIPPCGIAFGTAISVACTTGVANDDAGAPGANECVIVVGYK
jgi:hypothetical protein